MRVIAVATLREFWAEHPTSEQPIKSWLHEVKGANWTGPVEIKQHYATASILKGGRVVFNIGGNKFRLVVQVAYQTQVVFIKFVGTHAQYDLINAETIQWTKGR